MGALLTLTAHAACTYKVELLTTPGSALPEVEAGDGDGDGAADYARLADAYPSMASVEDASAPLAISCDDLLKPDASTGDACLFSESTGCTRGVGTNCKSGTAICEQGVLRLGTIHRRYCEPVPMGVTYCAEHSAPCCITMHFCAATPGGGVLTEICAPGCEALKPTPGSTNFTSCPPPSPPGLGLEPVAGCTGDFICDSLGVPLGQGRLHQFDLGRGSIYWCENGVIQQVSLPQGSL